MKKTRLLILVFICMTLFSKTILAYSNEIYVKVPSFQVKVNNTIINNLKSKYPLLVYKDITYFPMTYNYANALGLKTEWSQETGFSVSRNKTTNIVNVVQDLTGNNSTATSYKAILPSFKIRVNGKEISNINEQYPLFVFRDITYFPMTWRFAVIEFDEKTGWDSKEGFSITNSIDTTSGSNASTVATVYTSVTLVSGDHYEGYTLNGVPNGHGILTTLEGIIIEGEFVNGNWPCNGKIKVIFPDKMIYEGDIDINGDLTGIGKVIEPDGTIYSGNLVKFMPEGYGETVYSDGDIYKGNYVNGLKEGYGEYYFPNGQYYKGSWKADVREGSGILLTSNGELLNVVCSSGEVISSMAYATSTTPSTPITSGTIETYIDGKFEGWEGDTIVQLINGQIWQQSSFHYEYHFAFMPKVLIYKSGNYFKMHVDGTREDVFVIRLK